MKVTGRLLVGTGLIAFVGFMALDGRTVFATPVNTVLVSGSDASLASQQTSYVISVW